MNSPESVAADNEGNIYVAEEEQIKKFTNSGAPANFEALGTNAISVNTFGQIDVDISEGVTKGDIYFLNGGAISIFAADGSALGKLDRGDRADFGGRPAFGVGPTGTVYVSNSAVSEIDRFTPTRNPVENGDFSGKIRERLGYFEFEGSELLSLASDFAGSVYGLNEKVLVKWGANRFGQLGSQSFFPLAERAFGLAFDPSSGDLFVLLESKIDVFSTEGTLLGSFGSGHLDQPDSIAINRSGEIFVANRGDGSVSIFEPEQPLPSVTVRAPSAVSAAAATLNGEVDTSSLPLSDCRFEYGPDASYGRTAACVPSPSTGGTPEQVSAAISGLSPATTYHYRLVAENANGVQRSTDELFDSSGPPSVSSISVDTVESGSATVSADIQPRAAATTYYVEYGEGGAYNSTSAKTELPGTSSGAPVRVSVPLSGLQIGGTYDFRFIAANSYGAASSKESVLTTCLYSRAPASAKLPDCRAYEQVSPVEKGHNDVGIGLYPDVIAQSGDAVAIGSYTALEGASSGSLYSGLGALRGADGWQPFKIDAPYSSRNEPVFTAGGSIELGSSADLTKLLIISPEVLAPGAVEGNGNLYYYDALADSYRLISTVPPENGFRNPLLGSVFLGGASDGSTFVFDSYASLESDPPLPPELVSNANSEGAVYDWSSSGGVHLVGVLPNGEVDPNGSLPAGALYYGVQEHAVSEDGRRIYWTDPTKALYLRENDQATVAVSHDESGQVLPATFDYATPDGSSAFLTSSSHLTSDASQNGSDLYRYDASTGQLTDLTPGRPGVDAEVTGFFGASDDGNYVYFQAEGALAEGATSGDSNIYVWHDGETRFIGSASDVFVSPGAIGVRWRVSPDGLDFGFLSARSGISGPNPQLPTPTDEAYLYSYGESSLVCASCHEGATHGNVRFIPASSGSGANLLEFQSQSAFSVVNGGKMFFSSPDSLVASDTNEARDVYEYEEGQVHLISGGDGEANSQLIGATPSGNDVFFITYDRLVGQDDDDYADVYDARVNGGLAAQGGSSTAPTCMGESCRGGANPGPGNLKPGSASLVGPGNHRNRSRRSPCRARKSEGARSSKGRCVRPKHKRARRKKRTSRHPRTSNPASHRRNGQ